MFFTNGIQQSFRSIAIKIFFRVCHCFLHLKDGLEGFFSFLSGVTSAIFLTTLFKIFEKYINITLIFTDLPPPRDWRILEFSSVFGGQFLVDFSQVCFLKAISCCQYVMWPRFPNLCSNAYHRFPQQKSAFPISPFGGNFNEINYCYLPLLTFTISEVNHISCTPEIQKSFINPTRMPKLLNFGRVFSIC